MSFRARYIRPTQVFVAVVFLLVNAGFTAVIHSCMMDDRMCCEMSADALPSRESGPSSPDASILSAAPGCCDNSLVGGSTGISAVPESKDRTEQQKTKAPKLVSDDPISSRSSLVAARGPHTHPDGNTSPRRALYLLSSALLI